MSAACWDFSGAAGLPGIGGGTETESHAARVQVLRHDVACAPSAPRYRLSCSAEMPTYSANVTSG